MKYMELIIVFGFCFACYILSRKIGRNYKLEIRENDIIIERRLVTQFLKISRINKVIKKRGGIVFYGDFEFNGRVGRGKASVVELMENEGGDLENLLSKLKEKGVAVF